MRALIWYTAIMLAVAGGAASCRQEGPAESTGKKIDQQMEQTGEAIEETGEDIRDQSQGRQ